MHSQFGLTAQPLPAPSPESPFASKENDMALPGFTAEASLGSARGRYTAGARTMPSQASADGVQLALMSACGTCNCQRGQCCADYPWGCECTSCGSSVPQIMDL